MHSGPRLRRGAADPGAMKFIPHGSRLCGVVRPGDAAQRRESAAPRPGHDVSPDRQIPGVRRSENTAAPILIDRALLRTRQRRALRGELATFLLD